MTASELLTITNQYKPLQITTNHYKHITKNHPPNIEVLMTEVLKLLITWYFLWDNMLIPRTNIGNL